MWVLKLGGSLYDSPQLLNWLRVLSETERPLVIVPGGGPFADQVRAAQQRWRIDDATCHAMALSAMDQFGRLLCGLHDGLRAASQPMQLHRICAAGATAVWLPAALDPPVERSWRISSDSLAAWLALELDAEGLVLVKSAPGLDAGDLLDEAFTDYRRRMKSPVWLMHRDDSAVWQAWCAGAAPRQLPQLQQLPDSST